MSHLFYAGMNVPHKPCEFLVVKSNPRASEAPQSGAFVQATAIYIPRTVIGKIHILCVKSIFAGSKRPTSLIQGNGIVATHNPTIAATTTLVQKGRRKI